MLLVEYKLTNAIGKQFGNVSKVMRLFLKIKSPYLNEKNIYETDS